MRGRWYTETKLSDNGTNEFWFVISCVVILVDVER